MRKKILLAAAIFAVASINSFGAACVSGTLASLGSSVCTVGATDQWQLSNFLMFGNVGQVTDFPRDIAAGDLNVTFNSLGSNGFSITYTLAEGAPNFFNVNNPDGSVDDQAAQWRNGIWITGLTGAASSIVSINMSASGFYGDASLTLNKKFSDQVGGSPLRANIAETLSPVLITEQGENGNQNEHESEAERICLGQCRLARRGTERGGA